MAGMSENSPESALNGHGGQLSESAAAADGRGLATEGPAASADEHAAAEAGAPAGVVDDLCRLTVCGPSRSVELAVPAHVPLIDLLPALLGHLGDGLADTGLEHDGWVLQRLGDPPLREDLSVAALGLHDGDMVHLRPRSGHLPPLDFDDLIDGIAVGISGRPDRWRPEMSRHLLARLLGAPLAAGLVLLASHLSALADLVAAGLAVILLALTAAAARSFADMPAAALLAAATIGYAGLAGAELPLLGAGSRGSSLLAWSMLRAALLAGGAAIAGASAAVVIVMGGRRPALAGTIIAALLAAAGGAAATFGRLSPAAAAALVLTLVMPVGGWVPVLSFRLAKMRLDPTPSSADELQDDLDPLPGQHVLERTRWADRYMTALYCGLAVVAGGCLAVLGISASLRAQAVAIDAIVLLLLHARVLVAARHRLAMVIPATGGAAVLITVAGLRADSRSWLPILAVLMVAATLLFVAERSLPDHKLLPHWGRGGDLLQTLAAALLLPLTLWVLNLYAFVRSARG
jgi:type VII secretion integral membrane protein EccD